MYLCLSEGFVHFGETAFALIQAFLVSFLREDPKYKRNVRAQNPLL